MSILTAEQLTELRQEMARDEVVDWSKTQLNAACQAFEDAIEAVKLSVSVDIDTATSPIVLSNPLKKKLAKFYFRQKFGRGG